MGLLNCEAIINQLLSSTDNMLSDTMPENLRHWYNPFSTVQNVQTAFLFNFSTKRVSRKIKFFVAHYFATGQLAPVSHIPRPKSLGLIFNASF